MTRFGSFLALLFVLWLSTGQNAHAAQSYDNCTGFITSLPTTISTQGTWCLNKDLATAITSGNAIVIATNNVILDCNDFKLGGLAAGLATQTSGVYAADRFNITIRHCNIRGFYFGVDLEASSSTTSGGHAVENNRFDGNTRTGIIVRGDGSVVRGNRIFDTGGATVGNGSAYGIATTYNVDVLDNTVSGVVATTGSAGSGIGIQTFLNSSNSVNSNRISGVLGDGANVGTSIYNFSVARMALRNNDLLGSAATGSVGIFCQDGTASAKNNILNGFTTAMNLCADDGDNSVH